jgi:RNA polymerase sigma factor (sigma-70 family)
MQFACLDELLMRRHNRLLLRLARSVVRDDDDARDVVQEVYLRAYRRLDQFRGPDGFASWLAQIALNEARGRARKPSAAVDGGGVLWDLRAVQTDEPEFDAMSCEATQIIERAIDGLPENFRVVFMLRGVEQLSIAETASVLGIKEATVKTRFHRARSLLRRALDRRLEELVPTSFDPRLNDAARWSIAAANGFGDVRRTPDEVTPKLAALHFYQLALAAPEPPKDSFDRAAAQRGKRLFARKADCARCHVPPLFTEPGWNLHEPDEIGSDDFHANRGPEGRYRTAPLKGLWTHGKGGYYHDGRFDSLGEVVSHYNDYLGLGLSSSERRDVVEYLKSL